MPQGTVSSEDYICVDSGASSGCYGNFLWIAKDIPYVAVQDKPQYCSLAHVHGVSAAPCMLAASIVARSCRILALVLRIPTSKAKLAARQAVYDDASLILQSCARSARHVFVFIDFHGIVGEFASPGIGTCGDAAPLDAGGELLANFMGRWSLRADATFDSCQQGPTATWTSSIGRSSRKDFVLCSADLQLGFFLVFG